MLFYANVLACVKDGIIIQVYDANEQIILLKPWMYADHNLNVIDQYTISFDPVILLKAGYDS